MTSIRPFLLTAGHHWSVDVNSSTPHVTLAKIKSTHADKAAENKEWGTGKETEGIAKGKAEVLL